MNIVASLLCVYRSERILLSYFTDASVGGGSFSKCHLGNFVISDGMAIRSFVLTVAFY